MSYSTVWSPAADHILLVFGITAKTQLNLRIYDGQGNKAEDPTDAGSMAAGQILGTSNLVALKWNGMVRVYGFLNITPEGETTATKFLYMLSPVQHTLSDVKAPIGTLAGLAGTIGESEVGFLYYIDESSKIQELDLSNDQPRTVTSGSPLRTGTSIAACLCSNGKRYITYQPVNTSDPLQLFQPGSGEGLPMMNGSSQAKDKTPLAMVEYVKDGKSYLVVYYLRASDSKLQRSHLVNFSGDWVDTIVPNVSALASGTNLSAIWDHVKTKILLTYKSGKEVYCYSDKI